MYKTVPVASTSTLDKQDTKFVHESMPDEYFKDLKKWILELKKQIVSDSNNNVEELSLDKLLLDFEPD